MQAGKSQRSELRLVVMQSRPLGREEDKKRPSKLEALSLLLHGAGKEAEWEVRSSILLGVAHALAYPHHDCMPAIIVGRFPDARNAAYTSSIVSMHQPTSWQPPNHEGCGCNAQGAPPRRLGEIRPTDHHPSPGPTKTMALQAYLTACMDSHMTS
ncbi:hypothetical protein Tco_0884116, partial [Tanacetum coccineum]